MAATETEVTFSDGADAAASAPASRHVNLPATEDHAIEALSASGISKLLRSPAHYHVWRTAARAQTPAMAFGTIVHALVLEPHRAPPVAITPACERRSSIDKAIWADFEANLNGRVPMKQDEYDRALRVRDAVWTSAGARVLLKDVVSEVSIFWRDTQFDIPCKARLDALRPDHGVIDRKTTADATPDAFARSVANFSYHAQAAHYWRAVEHALHASPPFFAWIAIETEPPFGSRCYVIEVDALRLGGELADRATARYAAALRNDRWPGYIEAIEPLRLPKWALRIDAI
ncbi:PD-(D/E)XK nuclease-like domain-containing protein [Caballeronia sp. J97]|uniref:PD-(D/E)XK nuclease-like domain-containing protein n=1 Tax=Caballeronia sp. J97 TaxID=2805429 RepID=UPI002AB125D7|nr:PD-(D/E)XK nuclease-like domain-containing protein [Caballeronia sp. J97]